MVSPQDQQQRLYQKEKVVAIEARKKFTGTLTFFCLGAKDDDAPPSTIAGKAELSNRGLGPSSITCDVTAATVHTHLTEKYPPLSLAGGYELLLFQRGGENRGFYSLPTPYSPSRLKDIAGQATIYIRPLQKDILTEEVRNDGQSIDEISCRSINYLRIVRITQ